MPVVTVRPDSTVVNTFAVNGAASAHAATNDDNDATYVDSDVGGYVECYVGFGNYVIPAGAFIRKVRFGYRYATVAPGAITLWYSRFVTGGVAESPETHNQIRTNITTETGAWRTVAPGGSGWTQSVVNEIYISVYPGLWTGNVQMQRFYEFYTELDVNYNPTTTVTGPASPVTTTTRPAITFTYADADGDAMEAYRIRIFSSTQYNASGFNPNTSSATWDSGRVSASSPPSLVRPTVDLFNLITYRAYVWVFQSGAVLAPPGNGVSASTNFIQFTMNVTPPALPTITAVANNVINSVTLTYKANDSLAQEVFFERSSDGGTTWAPVRAAHGVTITTTIAGASDYEVVANKNVIYRARTAYTSGGSTISSAYTASTNPVLLTYKSWFLRSTTYPGLIYLDLDVIGDTFDQNKPEDSAIFNPLGRKRKVKVADVIKGEEGNLFLDFTSEANYTTFETMRNLQEVLLLQRGWTGEQWYIVFTEVREMNLHRYTPTYRYVKIGWVEVDAPPV